VAASETVVKERLTDLLNVQAAGTWSTTVASTNLDRHATGIAEAAREAALDIARVIVSNPKHYHRNLFISGTPTSLTHQAELPDYGCEYDPIEIENYTSAGYRRGIPVDDPFLVEEYRANPTNIYDAIAHDASGSKIGGFYAVQNNRIYFSGLNCRGYFPVISRTGVLTIIPDEYEGPWYYIAAGILLKEGDNLQPIAQHYMELGQSALQAIAREGLMPPLQDYMEVKNGR
jgi:hypothetical protein